MITLKQHVPSFVETDDDPPKVTRADNWKELLETDWPKSFAGGWGGKQFFRFSVTNKSPSGATLIAEYDNGDWWWVVGFLNGPIPEDVPEWTPSPKSAAGIERWNSGDFR